MKRMRLVAGALIVVAVLLWLSRPSPIPVDTGPVIRGPLTVTVDEEGRTRLRDRFVVSAPVDGQLARVKLREGDVVTAGMVLARITPAPLDPRLRREALARLDAAADAHRAADATVVRAQGALEQARRDRERTEQLARERIAAPEALEQARLAETSRAQELESADYQAQAAGHEVDLARAALLEAAPDQGAAGTAVEVRAPARGRILRIPERSERVVATGAPLLEIGDASSIEIVAEILSSDAVKVEPHDSVGIEDWGGDHPLAGRVRLVEPSGFSKISALGVEEQRVRVIIDPSDAPPSLGDGYRVEVRIVVWAKDDVLKVPVSALFRTGEQWAVFLVQHQRAVSRNVAVGARSPFEAQITAGLSPEDTVVLHPSDQITDGARVTGRASP